MRESSWAEVAAQAGIPQGNMEYFSSPEEVVAALRSRRVSALVMASLWAFTEKQRDPELQVGVGVGGPTATIAVRKDEPELRKALDDFLAGARRSGKWSQLVIQYFGLEALKFLDESKAAPPR